VLLPRVQNILHSTPFYTDFWMKTSAKFYNCALITHHKHIKKPDSFYLNNQTFLIQEMEGLFSKNLFIG